MHEQLATRGEGVCEFARLCDHRPKPAPRRARGACAGSSAERRRVLTMLMSYNGGLLPSAASSKTMQVGDLPMTATEVVKYETKAKPRRYSVWHGIIFAVILWWLLH